MKLLRLVFITIVCVLFWGSASNADTESSAKEAKMRMAASTLKLTLIPKVEKLPIDLTAIADSVIGIMGRDESWKKSRKNAYDYLLSLAEKKIQEKCNKLKVDSEWREGVVKDVRSSAKSAVEKNLSRSFESIFSSIRETAVEAQHGRLNLGVYPGAEEVEEYIRTGKKEGLEKSLLSRFSRMQKKSVYSENSDWFRDMRIPDILKDSRSQYSRQMKIVKDAKPGDKDRTPSEIESGIRKSIEGYRKSREYAYGVFPSVSREIPGRAGKLATEKFIRAISGMEFTVQSDDIAGLIERQGLEKHREASASRELCMKEFSRGMDEKALSRYAEGLSQPKKKELQALMKSIQGSSSYKKAQEGLAGRSLGSSFKSVRQGISYRQMQDFFRPLADRSWRPTIGMIESHDNSLWINIPDPLSMPGISQAKPSQKKLLEETISEVRKIEKELVSKGLGALKRQKKIVDDVESGIKKPEALKGISSEKELRDEFTRQVKEKYSGWSRDYTELFPKVEKDIRTRADAIWNNEKARREKPVDSQGNKSGSQGSIGGKDSGSDPGGGVGVEGGGFGPDEGKGSPDVIIDLAYRGGILRKNRVLVRIVSVRNKEVFEYSLKPVKGANGEIMMKIQRNFESLLRSAGRGDREVKFHVVTRVFNWEMLMGIIFDLRDCASRALGKVGNKVKIYWLDIRMEGKGYKDYREYKDNFIVPPDFREKSRFLA